MAALALRNPRWREDLGNIISFQKRSFVKGLQGKAREEVIVGFMKASGLERDETTASLGRMIDKAKDEDFAATREEIMMAEIDQHDPLAERLWHRKWQMLVASDDTGGLVTIDDPVCLRWRDGLPHGGMSPGFAVLGTEVIFPISTNIALEGNVRGRRERDRRRRVVGRRAEQPHHQQCRKPDLRARSRFQIQATTAERVG
jgi:hypothetical protein